MWVCAQLEPQRTALALHCLSLNGFETYCPRLREQRRSHGRKIVRTPTGVSWLRLCDDSFGVVECEVVAGCELPKPRGLMPGMRVRVVSGPLSERIGMLALLKPRERVLVLLHLLGGEQRVDLARNAVEAV